MTLLFLSICIGLALQRIVVGITLQCYGGLQESTLAALNSTSRYPSQGALYLYTRPLSESSCLTGGRLVWLNFCYLAQLSNSTEPVFTIALLEDNGSQYITRYVYTELEDKEFCLERHDISSCCKWIKTVSLDVKSSFLLAVITSSAFEDNGYIYEVSGTAPGMISDPIDIPEEGGVVEDLERDTSIRIPQLAVRLVLENEIQLTVDFLNDYLHFIGGGLVVLTLLVSGIAIIFLCRLKIKFKQLQKAIRKRKEMTESQLEDIKDGDPYMNMVSSPVDRNFGQKPCFQLPSEGDYGYTDMILQDKTDGGYAAVSPQPPGGLRFDRKPSLITLKLQAIKLQNIEMQNCVPMLEPHPSDPKAYQMPATNEDSLYAHCRRLNLKNIPRDSVTLGEELGKGQFGKVLRGTWSKADKDRQQPEQDKHEEVAVKMLKDDSSTGTTVKFLREAVIMGQFSHPNVVRLFGVVAEGEPKMLILELLSAGDLLKILKSHHQFNSKDGVVDQDLPRTLLSYCRQVVAGMKHLSGKGFIHRDLAARNILVSEDGSCKIADFGMARDLIDENYYMTQGGRIPVKWTAPEALNYKRFSTASDVWSYGIVMYEIWSLGHKPFEGCSNDKVMKMMDSGQRLAPPPGCPRDIYSIMIKCWHSSAESRPPFDDVFQLLSLPDTKILKPGVPTEEGEEQPAFPSLGDTLASSAHLFKDLQNAYLQQETKL